MLKCKVCGMLIENCDRTRCLDPQISVTWRATDWIEIAEIVRHYFKLMEAFDPGGEHRADKDKYVFMLEEVERRISEAVRLKDGSR